MKPASLRSATNGAVDDGETNGTRRSRATESAMATTPSLLAGPTNAWTPCATISPASAASPSPMSNVSPKECSTGLPQTPPASLTCSIASSAAR